MAGDTPTAQSLEQPVKAKELLDQDRRQFEDCNSCRIVGKFAASFASSYPPVGWYPSLLTKYTFLCIGGTAFIGLAGYTYWEGMKHLESNRAAILKSKPFVGIGGRKAGLAGISLGLAWMGIYRLFG